MLGGSPGATRPPSGRQVELHSGEQAAVVVEVGGGLRRYRAAGWDVLDGYSLEEMCSGARGQILVPWPNRIEDGAYEFRGVRLQLPLSEPGKRNAIHGLARWAGWAVAEVDPDRAVLEHTVSAQAGYPFSVRVQVVYTLDENGLTVRATATNVGAEPCPYGAGAHPYVTVGDPTIDDAVLEFAAGTSLRPDDRGIPVGQEPVAGGRFDFSSPRSLRGVEIDHAFTDLARDDQGRAWVILSRPDGSRSVALWADSAHPYLMLFTGDTLPEPARRRSGLGVEPMTCAPNAFRSGAGLRVLEPGESFSAAWGIQPRAAELPQQA